MYCLAMLLSTCMLINGFTPVCGRLSVMELPPMCIAWIRLDTAGILLFLTTQATGKELPSGRSNFPLLRLPAVLYVPINQILYFNGLKPNNAIPGKEMR